MEVNPYQPPEVLGNALSSDEPAASGPLRRPLGIWALAGLHLLAGLFLLAALIVFFYGLRSGKVTVAPIDDANGEVTSSFYWFVAISCGFMAVLGLSSAIGMWRGARWGWWLAAFYYVWAVLGVVADFMILVPRLSHLDVESNALWIIGKVIQLAIHALILAYLFKPNVLAFCHLPSLRIDRAMIPLVVLAVIVLAATYFVMRTQLAGAF